MYFLKGFGNSIDILDSSCLGLLIFPLLYFLGKNCMLSLKSVDEKSIFTCVIDNLCSLP